MDRKKKITATVINDLTYDQRMKRICTTLAQEGYEVELVGRRLPNSAPLPPQPYKQTRLYCFFTKGKLFYAEYNLRLFFYLLLKKADILNAIDLDTLVPCYLIGKLKRKPVVYDAHEYFTEVPEVVHRPFTKKVWERVASTIIPKLKYCYTVGPMLAQVFTERYGTPFTFITNAPELKPLPATERKENVLLYQGALNKGRGIENYIDMMPLLPGMELWIAGEGDLSETLRRRAKEKRVEHSVKFMGHIPPDKLKEITASAYIGLNVSENAGLSYYYSLNNKFFDHIHALLPTIANKFPEYEALNTIYNVQVFADATPQSVAGQVKLLTENKSLYSTLAANCQKAREVLSWDTEKKKLAAFYKNVI